MGEEDRVLSLRLHHLFCIQTFVGCGYSKAFTENMYRVIRGLRERPFRLVRGADDLCAACPNCREGCCTFEKPELYDQNVMNILKARGINAAICYEGKETQFSHILEQCTISPALISECCPGCEWTELCLHNLEGNA